jgi:hypothetical protein
MRVISNHSSCFPPSYKNIFQISGTSLKLKLHLNIIFSTDVESNLKWFKFKLFKPLLLIDRFMNLVAFLSTDSSLSFCEFFETQQTLQYSRTGKSFKQ